MSPTRIHTDNEKNTMMTFIKGHAPSYTKKGKDHHQYKHGYGSAKNKNPLYQKWASMKRRCLNKNEKAYPRYGGAGVTISDEWMDFENFRRDMEPSFKKGLSLDRIDNNKGYSKENCRWIPLSQQSRNRRVVDLYEYEGKQLTTRELAEIIGIRAETMRARLKKWNWSIERAMAKKIKCPIPRNPALYCNITRL
jgi:hypothetical protein